jgi:hypothetical protein
LVRGPPSLARGAPTYYTVQASVWSPFWPAILVTPTVEPVGAATLTSGFYINSASAQSISITSQRSDQINITISFRLSTPGYLLPPENLVVATAGGESEHKHTHTHTRQHAHRCNARAIAARECDRRAFPC